MDNNKGGSNNVTSRRALLSNLGLAAIALPTMAADPLQLFAIPLQNRKKSKSLYRFAVGMFMQESSTFCPEVSRLERFQNDVLVLGDDVLPTAKRSISYLGGIIKAATNLGIEVIPTVAASASPYGVVEKSAYEHITSGLYERLESADHNVFDEPPSRPDINQLALFQGLGGYDVRQHRKGSSYTLVGNCATDDP